MSSDHISVKRPDVGDQPARDVCGTGVLSLDHRVREVHIGRSLVDEAFAVAVHDELSRHHPLVEHELQAPVGPAHGGKPPRLVEQVGRAADLLPRANAVAHGCGIAEAPVLLEHGQVLPAPLHVMVETTRGEDDAAPCADALLPTVAFHHRADHRSVDIGDQLGHRRTEPQRDVALLHRQPETRGKRLPDRGHPVAEYPRPEHPPDQLQQHRLAAPVLPHLIEQPKILGGEPDSLRRQRERLPAGSALRRRDRAGRWRAH